MKITNKDMLLITGKNLVLREIKDFICKTDEHRVTNDVYTTGSNLINKTLSSTYKDYSVSFNFKRNKPFKLLTNDVNDEIFKFHIYKKETKQYVILKLKGLTSYQIINGKYNLTFQWGEINAE